jgi:hypothetical protein
MYLPAQSFQGRVGPKQAQRLPKDVDARAVLEFWLKTQAGELIEQISIFLAVG